MDKKEYRRIRIGYIKARTRPRIGRIKPKDLAGYVKE